MKLSPFPLPYGNVFRNGLHPLKSGGLLVIALIAMAPASAATTSAWDGGAGNDDLSSANNWNPDGVPSGQTDGNVAQWNGSPSGTLNLVFSSAFGNGSGSNYGVDVSLTAAQTGSVTINSSGIGTFRVKNITIASGAGAFSVGTGGNAMSWYLGGDGNANSTFTNNSSQTATLGSQITELSTGYNKARTLTFAGSGNWDVAAVLKTVSTGVLTLQKNGGGTLTLTGANTYTGTTTVSGGTLVLSGGGSINNTSSVSVNGAGAMFRYDSSVALTKTVTFGASGGTFLYNSTAKYTGGSGSILANTGDTLGGVGALGNVTIASGGTLTPGALGNGSAGMLTVDSLTLQAGAVSQFDVVNASSFDSIHSAGSKALNGTLNLAFSSALTGGASLALFSGAGFLSGNFSSIVATGAYTGTFNWTGSYFELVSGGQTLTFDHGTGLLAISVIPEPSSALLLLAGGLMVLVLRRRRRLA